MFLHFARQKLLANEFCAYAKYNLLRWPLDYCVLRSCIFTWVTCLLPIGRTAQALLDCVYGMKQKWY